MSLLLSIRNLTKRYPGGNAGLAGLDLDLHAGVVGLIGPNGSGKSTLFRILSTLSRPTEGKVTFGGINLVAEPDRVRQQLGYLPQHFGVYDNLSATEFLHYMAALRGLTGRKARAAVDELLEFFGLGTVKSRPLSAFSGGMLQRVGLAQALLGNPRLLLLDEPTVGLDPVERQRVRQLLTTLAEGRLILIATHVLSDLEMLAGHLVLLRGGRLVWQGTPQALLEASRGRVWETVLPTVPAGFDRHITATVLTPDGIRLRFVSAAQPDTDAMPVEPTLEDACAWAFAGRQERPA